MRKLKCIIPAFAALLLLGCSNDDYVRFDTLSRNGDVFYMGQKIAVWAGVEVSDKEAATYRWSCSGGSFTGPQNVFRTTWVAPYQRGEYTVTCTVECNGKSDTRSASFQVSEYFFETFTYTPTGYTATNVTPTYKDGAAYVTGSRNATQGRYYYTFTDPELLPPYSFSTDVGWKDTYKSTSTQTAVMLRMVRPSENNVLATKYVRYINLEIYPTAVSPSANYKLLFSDTNTSTSQTGSVTLASGHIPEFAWASGVWNTLSIAVESDFTVVLRAGGNELVRSAELKNWRTDNNISHKMQLNSFEYHIYDGCNIMIDNINLYKEE